MKCVRVVLFVVGVLALPLVAAAAQGRSAANKCKNTPQAGQNGNSQRGAAAVAAAQADKCPAPVLPPAPSSPPTGLNRAMGMVYEDIDGSGSRDPFAGELGIAGFSVQLLWNGQVLATTTSDADGNFEFDGLGNATYSVCVVVQTGYMQTAPTAGNGCGGLGYTFTFNNAFETWAAHNDFGMLQQ